MDQHETNIHIKARSQYRPKKRFRGNQWTKKVNSVAGSTSLTPDLTQGASTVLSPTKSSSGEGPFSSSTPQTNANNGCLTRHEVDSISHSKLSNHTSFDTDESMNITEEATQPSITGLSYY